MIKMFIVNNNIWNLYFVNPSNNNLQRSDGTFTLGVTDRNTRCVYLNNRLQGYMLDKVLCHELVHVYMFEYHYDISVETEEMIADFIATYGRDIFQTADALLGIVTKIAR